MSALGHLRRVVHRRPRLADVTIALAVFAATLLTTFVGHPASTVGNGEVALFAAVAGCGVLVGRRQHPLGALAVSAMAAELFLIEFGGTSGVLILLAPAIALYTLADVAERRVSTVVGTAAVAAFVVAHALLHPEMLGAENLAFAALGGLAIAAGQATRNRRAYVAEVERRAERAELDRDLDARRRVAEERLRIARDLHDSVGHHLALISVQSDVAGRALDVDPVAARTALSHVKGASRTALEELRDTISLLRQPGEPVAPTSIPAAGLDALDELLGSMRASGLDIEVAIEGGAAPLAPASDLTAYRVIQESLTNVYKHSVTRHARLTLAYLPGELRITVDDVGGGKVGVRGETRPVSGGGHGIVGMRERVLALGGRFTAEPGPGGAFCVVAILPAKPLDAALEVTA